MNFNSVLVKPFKLRVNYSKLSRKEDTKCSDWIKEESSDGLKFKWRPFIDTVRNSVYFGIETKELNVPLAVIGSYEVIGCDLRGEFNHLYEEDGNIFLNFCGKKSSKENCEVIVSVMAVFVKDFASKLLPVGGNFHKAGLEKVPDNVYESTVILEGITQLKFCSWYSSNIPSFHQYITKDGEFSMLPKDFSKEAMVEIQFFLMNGLIRDANHQILEEMLEFEKLFPFPILRDQIEFMLSRHLNSHLDVERIFELAMKQELTLLKNKAMALCIGIPKFREQLKEKNFKIFSDEILRRFMCGAEEINLNI